MKTTGAERAMIYERRMRIDSLGSARGQFKREYGLDHDPEWMTLSPAEELVVMRKRAGLTLKGAAKACGISHVTLIKYEAGRGDDLLYRGFLLHRTKNGL